VTAQSKLAMLLTVCAVLTAGCLISIMKTLDPAVSAADSNPVPKHALLAGDLHSITWSNLRASASTSATPEVLRSAAEAAATSTNAATQYLAAMLYFRLGQPEQAREIFLRLDPSAVPVQHLYLPYRICQKPNSSVNPYTTRMRIAARIDALAPLEAARFQAHQGHLSKSLHAYLRTDPSCWSPHDASCLKRIKLVPGLRPDAERIIEAAMRSQHLPSDVRASLEDGALGKITREQESVLRKAIATDDQAALLVVPALERTLSVRRHFLNREYDKLLDQHEHRNPIAESDEAILLLFLAAVKMGRSELAECWGREIKRRTPTREVLEWVDRLLISS
jgi:hypothetical protein